MEGFRGMKGEK